MRHQWIIMGALCGVLSNAYASAGQYRQRGDHHGNICRSTVLNAVGHYWRSTRLVGNEMTVNVHTM